MRLSRPLLAASTSPALLMLILFYVLAVDMHQTLGGWPSSIGEGGFPPHLVLHARITMYVCVALVCATVFLLPLSVVVCAVVRRWRHLLPYLGMYAAACLICIGLTQLAPAQYLYWWRD